ncbi:MAG: asparagine synthase-related protein [Brachybacterium sp.]
MLTVVPHLSTRWTGDDRGQFVRVTPGTPLTVSLTPRSLRRSGELFSAVLVTDDEILLLTDHLRSWPLFYAVHGETVHVGEDAFSVADALGGRTLEAGAAAEFLHIGFVLGDRSLLRGVHQVPAGTTVRIDRVTGAVSRHLERRLHLRDPDFDSVDSFTQAFAEALDAAMAQLYERADGRVIALPLSAGLDSRLLAALLARDRYPNVMTFTYGLPGNAEAQASARIAESLGLPWRQVSHTPEQLRRAWTDPSTESFLREASGGASLPHIQDWYAIRALTADGTLPPGSLVIPGHTVVSSAKDEQLRHRREVTPAAVVDSFRPWHFSLRSRSRRAVRLPSVIHELQTFFTEVSLDGDRRSTMDALRWFWQRERQAKYILNSVRGYEHADLEWALPMHELSVWEVYEAAPDGAIASREWYRQMTEEIYSAVSGEPAPTAAPRSTERSLARRTAAAAAKCTGLPQLRSRVRTVRAVVDHPLGFDALITGASRREVAARTAAGMTPLGEFAEQFLADEWVPGSSLFTSQDD